MKDLEFQVQKFRALGRDYFNMCERKVVQDEADLRNQFFAKSNPYFEIRFDEVEYGSKQKGHCDVLKFKILSRDWYLTKIKTIVLKFFSSRYKELKVTLTGGKNFKRKDYDAICDFTQNEQTLKKCKSQDQDEGQQTESMHEANLSKSQSKRKFKKFDIHEKDPKVIQRRQEFQRDYVAQFLENHKIKTGFTENNDPENPRKIQQNLEI